MSNKKRRNTNRAAFMRNFSLNEINRFVLIDEDMSYEDKKISLRKLMKDYGLQYKRLIHYVKDVFYHL